MSEHQTYKQQVVQTCHTLLKRGYLKATGQHLAALGTLRLGFIIHGISTCVSLFPFTRTGEMSFVTFSILNDDVIITKGRQRNLRSCWECKNKFYGCA
jgi:ribulose-5-phosphate 4-epimerase/fuculose-1-phosphate aldolase